MCLTCIEKLQARMDEAAEHQPAERLIVHLDNFVDIAHGSIADEEQVTNQLHQEGPDCWCRPIIIEPFDDRMAIDIVAEYIEHDVGEVIC